MESLRQMVEIRRGKEFGNMTQMAYLCRHNGMQW